ncbi:MAG: prephenate dehydrogenase dimerization domain-containing protein, partial [Anaerolineae bacterium]
VHDRLVGLSSHLPYLTATALMQTAVAFQDEQVWSVTASGFRDTSRLAGSDPAMMLDILLTNRTAVLEHLQKYGEALTAVQQLLQANDEKALAKWLAAAQSHYQEYKTKKQK